MRVMVDTNIFLDILLNRPNFKDESINVLDLIRDKQDQIFVSASSFKDLYYFAAKTFHSSKKAKQYICDIYSRITKVISLTADDAIEAIYRDGDYEDNCLILSAIQSTCDAIITRNLKDFSQHGIPIFSPPEFIKHR